jgi:catechol 2,3-dioxygenase-like lactoylglutathione lyase family enzyme
MIGYVTLGTNDLERASAFYDGLFAALGAKQIQPNDRIRLWSAGRDTPMLGVSVPFDGERASSGNGTMVALNVGSKDKVEAMYASALELGATDEGAPGPRGAGPFYGGYFRDLDGNKLVVFYIAS